MGLLRQSFIAVLIAQVLLSIGNSLFFLTDVNGFLALFGFYGVLHDHSSALIGYVFFSSIVSTVVDGVRIVLWQPALTGSTMGILDTLQAVYEMLLYFGIGIKLIGGIFCVFLVRQLQRRRNDNEPLLTLDNVV
eukprot:TRINITY_DN13648_c0_g1_i2.p1 TRINITY_DN13648_c0_g1~~TRINITY_DN13648_c0_g1_i2.p1  ORF type:complete len:134 (-),score=16.95 TRINITY_DN13648_c0_g1_i2:40-441(-)